MSHKSNYDTHHLLPQMYKGCLKNPSDINRKENKKTVRRPRHTHKHGKDVQILQQGHGWKTQNLIYQYGKKNLQGIG